MGSRVTQEKTLLPQDGKNSYSLVDMITGTSELRVSSAEIPLARFQEKTMHKTTCYIRRKR